MKRKLPITALGYHVLICPEFTDGQRWQVIVFTQAGNWQSASFAVDKAAAIVQRRKMFHLHKQIARKKVTRWRRTTTTFR